VTCCVCGLYSNERLVLYQCFLSIVRVKLGKLRPKFDSLFLLLLLLLLPPSPLLLLQYYHYHYHCYSLLLLLLLRHYNSDGGSSVHTFIRLDCLHALHTYLITHVINYLLTFHGAEFSASQEVPRIVWNPKFITSFTTACHLSLS